MEIEKMNDFISTIRTDRLRQIEQYREKGYLIDKKFRLVDKIEVKHEEQLFCFGVQASGRDVYFYLIDDGENAYYSISEIYELLWKMANIEGVSYVQNLLNDLIISEEKGKFIYKKIEYETKKSITVSRNGSVEVFDGSKKVDYQKLFILITLVQEKSNALFARGDNNQDYINGIIRLLIALIVSSKGHDILENKGWYYDQEKEKFYYKDILNSEEKRKKKYYLTQEEYEVIMRTES